MTRPTTAFDRQTRAFPAFDVLAIWYSGGCVQRRMAKPYSDADRDAAWAVLDAQAREVWERRADQIQANVARHFVAQGWGMVA